MGQAHHTGKCCPTMYPAYREQTKAFCRETGHKVGLGAPPGRRLSVKEAHQEAWEQLSELARAWTRERSGPVTG